jgi:phosphatidate phosphatase APP1
MPDLYITLQTLLNNPAFFYLSASPILLYPFLRQFRDKHYPNGPLMLRDASWQNLGGLIASLQAESDVFSYKMDRLDELHAWFPQRRFFLIGDDAQADPEVYAEAVRNWGGWFGGVFIRRALGMGMEEGDERRDGDQRFEKAFEGLERRIWHLFTEPGEVVGRIQEMVKA